MSVHVKHPIEIKHASTLSNLLIDCITRKTNDIDLAIESRKNEIASLQEEIEYLEIERDNIPGDVCHEVMEFMAKY